MANVVVKLGFVQSESVLNKNKILQEKYSGNRAFYSSNQMNMDHLRYIEKGSKEKLDFIAYSGNDEKSFGVFNQNGLLGQKEKANLRNNLRVTKSIIWYGIISFEEVFGKRFVPDNESVQRMLVIEFPRFFKNAGFDPNKIEWFAGLHENTQNRHIHFSFYEKEPSRYSLYKKGLHFVTKGQLNKHTIERFKVRAEQRLTDISSEIKLARKELLDITKNLLFSPQSKLRYRTDLQDRMTRLASTLPVSGRLGYDSASLANLRPQVDAVIDALIKSHNPLYQKFSKFCFRVKRKDSDTLKMLKASKIDEKEWAGYLVGDKYLADIYRRLGNKIIASAKGLKGKEKFTKSRLANKRTKKHTMKNLVLSVLKLNAEFEKNAIITFDEFLRRLTEEKEKQQEGEEFEKEME